MPDSSIDLRSGGGATLAGPDAMLFMKAVQLKSFIKLYLTTGIIPTRGVGIQRMLALATEITKKPYTRNTAEQAIEDLATWIETMRVAIPTTVDGKPV